MPVSAWPDVYCELTVRATFDEVPCVNVAVANIPPAVALTVFCPGADEDGTEKEAVNAPVEEVVTEEGVVETAPPAYVMETAALAGKLLPVTVTCVPAEPLAGLSEIDAVRYIAVRVMACVIDTVLVGVVEPLSAHLSKTSAP
jgi:hypothetical protein